MNLKKIQVAGLVGILCTNLFYAPVNASPRDELEQLNNEINYLQQQESLLVEQIDDSNQSLVDINIRIQNTKLAIEEKEKAIQQTEDKIKEKEQELKEQQQNKEQQYQAMKTRIQYIYENGGQTGLYLALLGEEDFTSFLNKIEYTNQICNYDRLMLLQFIKTIQEIQSIKQELLQQQANLIEQKNLLELEKIGLEENQQELENKILEMEKTRILLDSDILTMQGDAAALAYEIAVMDREIAAKEAEQEQIRQQQEQLAVADEQRSEPSVAAVSYDQGEYYEQPTQTYNSSGSTDITSYADQFVGNPYVWGGNSLTNGCDCSHFVWNVLKDTGHYDGGYATSDNWAYLGQSVGSLDQAQAGDVVVYSGHVAIYDGQGGIIEAKGSQWGITHDRQADCNTIVAIRRF